ncbi:MAG: hypothetical protein HC925_07505, partial [Coleofasciculaceae cyanobacterium SM2_3_26]|nr:hypothetical protein [Coleofasciculaceae cyanobacterium SM2_3_26]
MVHLNPACQTSSRLSWNQWMSEILEMPHLQADLHWQAGCLHVLFSGHPAPDRRWIVERLTQAIAMTDVAQLGDGTQPPPRQIFLYGCQLPTEEDEEEAPDASWLVRPERLDWMVRLDPSQCRSQFEERDPKTEFAERAAQIVQDEFHRLGVPGTVRAKAIAHPSPADPDRLRLLLIGDFTYSPDCSLIARSLARQLRELCPGGFYDAVILSRESGQELGGDRVKPLKPTVLLRVDLTPPEQLLERWARWGDTEAMDCLLDRLLSTLHLQGSTVWKASTLHLFLRQTAGDWREGDRQ